MVAPPHPVSPSSVPRRARNGPFVFTLVAAGYALLGGAVTLLGWAIPLPRLTDWAGRGISMFPNAGLGAIAGGTALLLVAGNLHPAATSRWRIVAARALAAALALLGGLTLLEHITGANLGIDEMLFRGTWGQAVSMAPMRIGVPASTSFLIIGVCLWLALAGRRGRRVASALAVLPVFIGSLSLAGYWFGANQLFGIARYTGISWQTATIIAALGVGIMTTLPRNGLMALLTRRDAGGTAARQLLLPIIAIPLLLGWLHILGQQAGMFDTAFGTAVRTLAEIVLLLGFLWLTANRISRQAEATRRVSRALLTSEERFTRFMQSLPGLAWIKDLEGRYVFTNDAAANAFQRPQGRLQGLTDADFLPAETAARFRDNDARALVDPGGVQVIETLRHADGTEHSSVVSKFPIPGPDGTPALVGGIAIDITDRLRAEEALREAHRRKDEFLATLAHELRNPLAPIRYALQLLVTTGPVDADGRWAVEVIDRQVQQMGRLLEDLLDVSRISYGKLTLRVERVELAAVVQRAMETSRPLIDAGELELTVDLPPEPIVMEGDPVRLAQVFSNLLNNAAKYTARGGSIRLTGRQRGNEALVSVEDTGIGIEPEILPRIFDLFSQANRPLAGAHGGLGIGLSLVRGLVKLHGGRIDARSAGAGEGSEFLVRLPAIPDSSPATAPAPPPARATARPGTQRILVADDLRDSADAMATLLRALGHEVHAVYDGAEALTAAASFAPRIVLLDIGMPKLDGHEVCRQLRRQPSGADLFIVAITGWGQESDRALTAEAGFDQHLVKPVNVDELLAMLDAFSAKS